MPKIDFAAAARRRTRTHARTATRSVRAVVIASRPKALLISTGIREAWLPRALVTIDPLKGAVVMPNWLALDKRLD